jgi:hypothetical protein
MLLGNYFNFIQIDKRNQLSENGLTKKVATFIHVIYFSQNKITTKRDDLMEIPLSKSFIGH